MKINTGLLSRMAVALFLTAGVAGAQVPTSPQSNAPNSGSPDCAELPVLNERLERANKILHDWPNLTRYAEANATLAAPAKFELRVVFMGDSITDAWVSPEFGGFFPGSLTSIGNQWTDYAADAYPVSSGCNCTPAENRSDSRRDERYSGKYGTDDGRTIEANLVSMAELAKANKIRVVLASVLPVSNYGHDHQGNPLDMRINRTAGENPGAECVDQEVRGGQRPHVPRLFFRYGRSARTVAAGSQRGRTSS